MLLKQKGMDEDMGQNIGKVGKHENHFWVHPGVWAREKQSFSLLFKLEINHALAISREMTPVVFGLPGSSIN